MGRELRPDSQGGIFESRACGTDMCILPTFSRKRVVSDLIAEIDCWFRKLDQLPLSEVLDHMIAMLRRSEETNGQDS